MSEGATWDFDTGCVVPDTLLVSSSRGVNRVAILDGDSTVELYVEPQHHKGLVGNLYLGRVVRVLPGMQSAFVDIGLVRTAFLHVSDVLRPVSDELPGDMNGHDEVAMDPGAADVPQNDSATDSEPVTIFRSAGPSIDELLKEGQEILVQVAKDPIGTKGARLTTHISLPGRNVVFLPTVDHVGVSRRIEDAQERERLRKIAQDVKPASAGVIVRTVAEGRDTDELREDIDMLKSQWDYMLTGCHSATAPALIHEDLDLVLRCIRDELSTRYQRVLIDDPVQFERVGGFVKRYMPRCEHLIELYEGSEPLFERFGVDLEIARAIDRKVWLKSGGTIVIDRTEALTSIDVNTGRYTGKSDLEETVFKINMEAAKEIAYQIRLRNIGGIIIIDFIDMELPEHRERVYRALVESLKADKARTNVLPMSPIGLVEMTRKRVRESLGQQLTERCFYCEGKGYLKSTALVADDAIARIRKVAAFAQYSIIHVTANARVAELLWVERRDRIAELERATGATILVKSDDVFHLEQLEVFGK